jgi:hypothetical protein
MQKEYPKWVLFLHITERGKRTRIEDPSFVEATEAQGDSVCRVASPNVEPLTAEGGRRNGARSDSRTLLFIFAKYPSFLFPFYMV